MLKQLFAFFNIIMLKIERSVPGAEQNFLECPERENGVGTEQNILPSHNSQIQRPLPTNN